MKKTILSITMIVATSFAFGQGMMGNDKEKSSSGGSSDAPMTLEGQIGWNTSTLSWDAPTIRFRYFAAENIAGRLTLGIQNSKSVDNFFENEQDNSGGAGTYEMKSSMFNVGIGGEYHFSGTDRLSPYAGLDIMFGSGSMTTAGDMSDGTTWIDQYSEESEAKTSMLGVNLVAGTDYYFAENFYLGLELGLGFGSTTVKEGTSSSTVAGTTTTVTSNESKSSSFGNNYISQFRLGWRF